MIVSLWIAIIFILLYEPIFGYFDFQKFKKNVQLDQRARTKYYIKTMIGLWIPTLYIIGIVLFSDLTLREIGLGFPKINTTSLNPWAIYIALGITALYLLSVCIFIVSYIFNENVRKQTIAKKEQLETPLAVFLPLSNKEKKMWTYISITAGITEEIIYRGFLTFALGYLFPMLSILWVILISSLLFGLAHTYQGFLGVVKTGAIGILFTIVYIGLDSIFPLMAFHFLFDFIARLGDSNPTEKQLHSAS